ncbi:MAG TPA: hypothetical protein VE968_03630 [Sphingomicrobium sp.]|nr:hypothetical protein [Sphingomicrobium sp.]
MFVKTISGRYYPLASIEHLFESEESRGTKVQSARLKDGNSEQLCPGELDRVLEASAHPFPAARDTYVLQEVVDENNRSIVERVPVLAWIVSPTRGVVPITIEGVNHGLDGTPAVLMPNGEVVVALSCTYASEQCYFAELRSSAEVA